MSRLKAELQRGRTRGRQSHSDPLPDFLSCTHFPAPSISALDKPAANGHSNRMKVRIPLFAATAFVLSAALLPAEEGFIIPVDRALKVGDKLKMSIEGETLSKMKVTAGEEVLQNEREEWKAQVEVTRTVDKVNTKGDASELTIEIHKASLTKEGAAAELLPAGTVVKAVAKAAGEKDEFTVNGEPVEEATRDVLGMLFDLSTDDKGKGDENKAFGVDKPRKPGEEWEVDAAELLATLPPEMPFVLDPATVKGKMKFVELTGEGENKSALLQGEVQLTMKGMQGLPPNANFEGSSMRISLDGLFPIVQDKPSTREGMSMIMTLRGNFPAGEGKVVEMDGETTMIRKTRVLP
jgi:hypothetical protein